MHEVYKEIAVLIGLDNAYKLYEYLSGQQITFPVKWLTKEYVAEMVIKRYDGRNLRYLAKEYNYSERWLREVLKKHIAEISVEKDNAETDE